MTPAIRNPQLDLALREDAPLFTISEDHPAIDWLVGQLEEAEWLHASVLLERAGRVPVTENRKRWVRALAEMSKGRVAGGQLGYKLVKKMTAEEYHHWRNAMKSQADKAIRRILQSDRVFYSRAAVTQSNGILESEKAGEPEYAI